MQILKYQSKKTDEEYQREADKAKTDVVGAFNAHFGSVSDNKSASESKTSTNKA